MTRSRSIAPLVALAVGACGASSPELKGEAPAVVEAGRSEEIDEAVPEAYREQPGSRPNPLEANAKDDRVASEAELRAVKTLMQRAERIRELPFLNDVPVRIQKKAAVAEYTKSKMDRAWMEQVRIRGIVLGLLKPDEPLEKEASDELADKLLGYYDPAGKYLAIAEKASYPLTYDMNARQGEEGRSVVLHELVHALQDQHFDLEHELARARTSDEKNAFMALVEGDATLAMVDFSLRRWGVKINSLISDPGFFEQVMTGLPPTMGAAAIGPKALQNPLVFRYSGGALFAAHLMVAGGHERVNAAFRRPPRSTSEILRPELYEKRFRPMKVAMPPLRPLLASGYSVVYEDVAGELELSGYLARGGVAADDVASEWNGDRFVALKRGDEYAAAWAIRFGDMNTARRAEELAEQTARASSDPEHLHSVLARGQDLLILRNVPESLAKPVLAAFAAASDRADSR